MLWGQESSHALKQFHGARYELLACDFRSIIKLCKGIALLFQASCSGGLPQIKTRGGFASQVMLQMPGAKALSLISRA